MKKHSLLLALTALSFSSFAAQPQGAEVAKGVNNATLQFVLDKPATISFGPPKGPWIDKNFEPGNYACFGPTFGVKFSLATPRPICRFTLKDGGLVAVVTPKPDPVPTPTPTPAPTVAWAKAASEYEGFEVKENVHVRYGISLNGKEIFVSRVVPPGVYDCNNQTFGPDPVPGVGKVCEISSEKGLKVTVTTPTRPTTPAPTPTPTPTPTPSPTPSNATLINTPEKYRAVADSFGTKAGLDFRFGQASKKPRTTVSYPTDRWVRSYTSLAGDSAVKQMDGVTANRGCSKWGYCGVYNIGEKLFGWTDDYSSTIANIAYIPVTPVPNGIVNKKYMGFGSAEVLNMGHNTMSTILQPSWTTYINKELDNTLNDENVARYAGLQGGYEQFRFDFKACPVASTRGYGRGGWTTNAIGLNCDGWIFGYGSNTAHNFFRLKAVRDGLKATNLTISNSGEFAFISAWDKANVRGVIVVVALSNGCQWCDTKPESQWNADWGNHRQAYAGLPGLGNYLGAKVIGEFVLPEGMTAPTELAVTTGKIKSAPDGYNRTQSFWIDNLLSEGNRKRFYDGDWSVSIPRSGVLAVADKYNRKVAFYDLRNLFMYYRDVYFNGKTDAQFNALMASRGAEPNQWPYTFDVAPQQKPSLIKTVDFQSDVTAVELSRNAPHRAFIGTMDGEFRTFDLGNGYLDQTAKTTGKPDDIKPMFNINVGQNITQIAFKKEIPDWDGSALYEKWAKSPEQFFWTVSREDQTATFLEFNKEMTSVAKRFVLQEAKIQDMTRLSDADNHGTESYVITIGDLEGMAAHNIMYGPIRMRTANQKNAPCPVAEPCQLTGGKQFEYVNKLPFPGYVFDITSSNIN